MSRVRAVVARGLLPELIFAASVVLLFSDPLFARRAFTGRDLLPYTLPMEKAIHGAYRRGALPVWLADVSGGRPLAANPNAGALYPVRPLVAALPFQAAARVFPVIHWILAGVGMMRFLRAIGVGGSGAWVGAFAYTFSGVGVSEVFWGNIHPGMALLPWALWAAAREVSSVRQRIVPLALVLGLDMLAGDVFTVGIAIAGCSLWILLEAGRDRWRLELAALAGAIVLACLLAAPQIVSASLWAPLTERAVVGLPLRTATLFSLPPWRLLEIVVPYPFGAVWSLDGSDVWVTGTRFFFASLFTGAIGALAIPMLFGLKSRGARFAVVLGAGAALVCVGPSFMPDSWGDWRSPVPLRYPEKLSVALVFALAIAAGLATDAFRRGARAPRWGLAAAGSLAFVALAAKLWPDVTQAAARALLSGRVTPHAAPRISYALAEAGILWVGTLVAVDLLPRSRRSSVAAALLLLAAVPVFANRRVARTEPEDSAARPPAFVRLSSRRDPRGLFRTVDESRFRAPSRLPVADAGRDPNGSDFYRASAFLYTTSLWGRGTVLNANPDVSDLSRLESLRRLSALFPSVPNGNALFSSLSLRFGIRWIDQEALSGFRRVGGDAVQAWDENDEALPSIRVPARIVETTGSVEALRAFPALAAGEVVVETGRSGASRSPAAEIGEIDDRPESLRFSVTSAGPAWVFVLRGFWPYRTVRIDGQDVDVAPAQLAFSAIPIPGGRHRVVWTEELPGGAVSWFGPVLFLLAVLLIGRARPRPVGERTA